MYCTGRRRALPRACTSRGSIPLEEDSRKGDACTSKGWIEDGTCSKFFCKGSALRLEEGLTSRIISCRGKTSLPLRQCVVSHQGNASLSLGQCVVSHQGNNSSEDLKLD